MAKYIPDKKYIPQEQRLNINNKINYLVTNDLVKESNFSQKDIFNLYTGNGGLHGLERKDFENYYQYSEAKKNIEQGQFFTPPSLCKLLIECINPDNTDIIYDLTFGIGSFFNYLPNESNIYGTEIDINSAKIAKFLYPDAKIEHGDIRSYIPPVKADLVVGNPPFNLKFNINGKNISSQMFYCIKAAETLKPAGLMAIVVPSSFLSDDFMDKSDIEVIDQHFNFVV